MHKSIFIRHSSLLKEKTVLRFLLEESVHQPCGSDRASAGHLSSSLSKDENQTQVAQLRVFLPTCLLPTHLSPHLNKAGFEVCNILYTSR